MSTLINIFEVMLFNHDGPIIHKVYLIEMLIHLANVLPLYKIRSNFRHVWYNQKVSMHICVFAV